MFIVIHEAIQCHTKVGAATVEALQRLTDRRFNDFCVACIVYEYQSSRLRLRDKNGKFIKSFRI